MDSTSLVFTSDFANMKVKVLNILWYVCKQTFNERCIKSQILMKFERNIAMRHIRKVIINGCAIECVCATVLSQCCKLFEKSSIS